jgi:hypothetical protein
MEPVPVLRRNGFFHLEFAMHDDYAAETLAIRAGTRRTEFGEH